MIFADRLKFASTGTSAASLTPGAAATACRTLAQAIADGALAVGAVNVPFAITDGTNWEDSLFAIGGTAQAPTLTRTQVLSSSAGGTTPATFSGAALTVFNTVPGSILSRVSIDSDVLFSTSVPLVQPGTAFMPQTLVNSALTFTPAAGAVRGAMAYLRLVADGVNVPNFSAFREWGGSVGYLNTGGIINEIQFFHDGTDAWFSVSQEINAQPIQVPATGLSLAGPTSGSVSQASTVFTVKLNPSYGTITSPVTVTPNDGGAGGTFSPASLTLPAGTTTGAFTFTYTAASAGSKPIGITNNAGLTNPATISYTAAVAQTGNPLTLASATYNSAGKFSQSLNGGYGMASNVTSGSKLTIEAWVKGSSTGSLAAVGGQGGVMWFGMAADGTAIARYGDSTDVGMTTTVQIGNNVWHHLSLAVDSSGSANFYVDGVLAATSTTASTFNFTSAGGRFGVRILPYGSSSSGLAYAGDVDEFAVYSGIKRTANFTPPTGAADGSDPTLLALWHLDGNGNDSTVRSAATVALRYASLSLVNETGGGPYVYTANTGSGGFGVASGDAILTTAFQNGVDGEMVVKCLTTPGNNINELFYAVDPSNVTGKHYDQLAYGMVGHPSTYDKFTQGNTTGSTVINSGALPGDYIKIRRTGSTLAMSVSRDSGATYTAGATWTGVSTGVLYLHVLATGAAQFSPVSSSGLA